MMSNNMGKWIWLSNIPFLGNITIKKLWDAFGSIDKITSATFQELSKVEGLSERAIRSLWETDKTADHGPAPFRSSDEALTYDDPFYPGNLLNIPDPPPVLYIKGDIRPEDGRAIGIVGTRRASHYGRSIAKRLAAELASLGMTIVSGMAAGIDTAAHEGALEAKGRTLAVLGCGIDIVYPPENAELASSIVSSGAILSEFPPGTKSEHWMFPQRNRIISGLSHGVVIIEAGYKSGAMITAKLALEQGREVFAVPGNIDSELSQGPHWLVKQGAKLTESVDDILDELKHVINVRRPVKGEKISIDLSSLDPEEHVVFGQLSSIPLHIDEIAARTGLGISKVLILLSRMEIKRFIIQLPGKLFVVR